MSCEYDTREEATLAALIEICANGGGATVRLHQADCLMGPDDEDESRCTCTPDIIDVPAGARVE